eukprot:scaffold2733_cov255-Pinguiococcus_pyrenoidosus.AAC.6
MLPLPSRPRQDLQIYQTRRARERMLDRIHHHDLLTVSLEQSLSGTSCDACRGKPRAIADVLATPGNYACASAASLHLVKLPLRKIKLIPLHERRVEPALEQLLHVAYHGLDVKHNQHLFNHGKAGERDDGLLALWSKCRKLPFSA